MSGVSVERWPIGSASGDRAWDELVARLPGANVFQSAGWARYGEALFRARALALLARDEGGAPCGALLFWIVPHAIERVLDWPLAPLAGRLARVLARDLRWSDGPLATDAATERALVAAALALAGRDGVRHVDAWSPPLAPPRLAPPGAAGGLAAWPSDDARTPVIDLARPAPELWAGLHESARKAVRKAQREGLVVETAATLAQLREHHAFFAACRAEMGLQAYGFRVARLLWETLGRDRARSARALAVKRGAEILAVMTVWHFAGSVQEAALAQSRASVEQRTRAADLLKWWTIETFAAEGAHSYDLAGVDLDAGDAHGLGIARFKGKWGARVVGRPRYRSLSLRDATAAVHV